MGRILSGRLRGAYVADPGSAGAGGRFHRVRIVRDVEHAVDDIETILRMSPDDKLKEHVRRQVARLVGGAGGGTGHGGDGGGTGGDGGEDGGDYAGSSGMDADATGAGPDEGEDGSPSDDFEASLWN